MNSPFGSINQAEVVQVLIHAAYAGGAAAVMVILTALGTVHFNGLTDILVTGALVPALKFVVTFFSSKGLPSGTVVDTAPNTPAQ